MAAAGTLAFLVVILVGIGLCLILLPVILEATNSSALNLTGGAATMVGFIPTLFIFLIIVVGIVGIMVGLSRR